MLDDKRVIKYKLYGNNLINMSKKTTELPQKTSIVSWDLLTWLDSEDATLSTKDKVFSVNNIWNRIFTDRSTTNLTEWTNLYYTEARVTANTTVVWLWNTKADKTNVLEKDNTTAYTPTLDYHPATKEYVDNATSDIIVDWFIKSLNAWEDMTIGQVYRNWNPNIILWTTNIVNLYTNTSTTWWPWNYTEITIATINAWVVPAWQKWFRLRSDLWKQLADQWNDEIDIRVYQWATLIFERKSDIQWWTSYDDIIQFNVNWTNNITLRIFQYERAIQYRNIYLDTFEYVRENTEKMYKALANDTNKLAIKWIVISNTEAGSAFNWSFNWVVSGFTNLNPTNWTIVTIDATKEWKVYNNPLIVDIITNDNIWDNVYLQNDWTIWLTPWTNSVVVWTVFSNTEIKINL